MKGILKLVIKKSKGILLVGLGILLLYAFLNYDPLVSTVPGLYSLRKMANILLPIVTTMYAGLFIQQVSLIYKLFEYAITRHIEELNKVAKDFHSELSKLDEKPISLRFHYESISNSIKLLWIDDRLCRIYHKLKKKYGGLLDDLGVHWPKLNKLLKKCQNICAEINNLDKKLRDLSSTILRNLKNKSFLEELLLMNSTEELVKDQKTILDKANIEALAGILELLLWYVLEEVYRKGERFHEINAEIIIENIMERNDWIFKPTIDHDTLKVGAYFLGKKVSPNEWKRSSSKLLKNIITGIFEKYGEQLDRLIELYRELKGEIIELHRELKEHLEDISATRFLPLVSVCKYIYP